jgi:hypothetical protein
MLTFFMWVIGVSFNTKENGKLNSKTGFQQKHNISNFSHFQKLELEENEFIITESVPEIEIEKDWFSISKKTFNFKNNKLKGNSNSYTTQLFSSKEIIPLYDLYCNWKFHLS